MGAFDSTILHTSRQTDLVNFDLQGGIFLRLLLLTLGLRYSVNQYRLHSMGAEFSSSHHQVLAVEQRAAVTGRSV